MKYKTVESAVKAYWRRKLGVSDLALYLLTNFNVKMDFIDDRMCSYIDLVEQEHLTVVREMRDLVGRELRIEAELKYWETEDSQELVRRAVESIIYSAAMHDEGIDLKNSVFSIKVDHLALIGDKEGVE